MTPEWATADAGYETDTHIALIASHYSRATVQRTQSNTTAPSSSGADGSKAAAAALTNQRLSMIHGELAHISRALRTIASFVSTAGVSQGKARESLNTLLNSEAQEGEKGQSRELLPIAPSPLI